MRSYTQISQNGQRGRRTPHSSFFTREPPEPRKAVFSRLYRLTDTMFFNRYRAGPGGAGARAAPARGGPRALDGMYVVCTLTYCVLYFRLLS